MVGPIGAHFGLNHLGQISTIGNVVVLSARLGRRPIVLFMKREPINLNAMMAMLMMHVVVKNMTWKAGAHLFWTFGQCIIYICMV
jgi:hypothetical protein